MVHQYAGASIFELGLLACPDAGELFLLVVAVFYDGFFFFAESSFNKGVAELSATFDVDSYLRIAYAYGHGFFAVADIEMDACVIGDVRLAVFTKGPYRGVALEVACCEQFVSEAYYAVPRAVNRAALFFQRVAQHSVGYGLRTFLAVALGAAYDFLLLWWHRSNKAFQVLGAELVGIAVEVD